MLPRISATIVFILLIAVSITYAYRLSITQWYLAPKLAELNIKLDCFDWSITERFSLRANKICLQYQGQTLELSEIDLSATELVIDNATLKHSSISMGPLTQTPSPSSQTSTDAQNPVDLLTFTLPESRPLLTIKSLQIQSDLFLSTVHLSLKENELNQFLIAGDINANIRLSNNQVSGNAQLSSDRVIKELLKAPLAKAPALLNAIQQKKAKLNSRHTFLLNSQWLQLSSQIDSQLPYSVNQCQVNFSIHGALESNFDLSSQAITIDASDLITQAKIQPSCLAQQAQSDAQKFLMNQMAFDWQLTVSDPIQLLNNQLSIPYMSLHSIDKVGNNAYQLKAHTISMLLDNPNTATGKFTLQATTKKVDSIRISADLSDATLTGEYQIALDELPSFIGLKTAETFINGAFSFTDILDRASAFNGEFNSQVKIASGKIGTYQFQHYNGKLVTKIDSKLRAKATLNSQIVGSRIQLNQTDTIKLSGFTNTVQAQFDLDAAEADVQFTAVSMLKSLQHPQITLSNLKMDSVGHYQTNLVASHRIATEGITAIATHTLSNQGHPFTLSIPKQTADRLNPLIGKFDPEVQLTNGYFSAIVKGDIEAQSAHFSLALEQISGLYKDYLINKLNSRPSASYQDKVITLDNSHFTLEELRAGVILQHIEGGFTLQNNQIAIRDLKGTLFGGAFLMDEYQIGALTQTANLSFKDIDASQLMALYNDPTIQLTGRYAGNLPISFDGNQIEIKQGELNNQDQGALIIENNAAFNAIKSQQKELNSVLSLLENLDIQKLDSQVKLGPSGELTLNVNLKGYNKKQAQEVNFNYNHEENVFTLLRALRLSDEITQKVEQKYRHE
ncbi:YdbH domain-containing protein [Marinomonas sp. 15G1-11]|uniref:YdbH domain-containing protein n=1 Tax=Marinomonas phaeophyticola TaxID=3004091 RepID=A0ABT4JXP4_9GAMM|nr:YdbH domain-containing protein [Marinomonas sp. 15G1-11]MCZ2723000.1 YdbH domain-containing protein [Marinomonas sp. 15G1-11]